MSSTKLKNLKKNDKHFASFNIVGNKNEIYFKINCFQLSSYRNKNNKNSSLQIIKNSFIAIWTF